MSDRRKSVEVVRTEQRGKPELRLALTKTANRRHIGLDKDKEIVAEIAALPQELDCVSPFMFSASNSPPNPDRIGWWWTRTRRLAGIDTKRRIHDSGAGPQLRASAKATAFAPWLVDTVTRTRP